MKMIYSSQALCAAAALFFAGSALAAPHPSLSDTPAAPDDPRIPKGNYGKGDPIKCGSRNSPGVLASGNGDSMCGSDYGSVFTCSADQKWLVSNCQSRSTPDRWCGCTESNGWQARGWTGSAGCVFFDKNMVDGVEQDATPSDDVC